ncbi:S8 family serine peptidase [Streptomyces sp. NPDC051840]|uniref:S8 family peptidase n=1 Tax=Streptomyces sp. NPDC051840 TaxID=3154752 RepID=UPI003428D187
MTPRPRRRTLPAATAALALVLGGGLLLPAPAAAAAEGSPGTAASPRYPTYDITLVTGDQVHYTDLPGPQDDITVDRAPGAHGGVQVQTYGENTYVVPAEAAALLAADKLDPELFNVTQLAAMGYDDARSGGIPVIAAAPRTRAAKAPAAPRGATRVRRLDSIGATAMKAGSRDARTFWKSVVPSTRARAFDASAGIGKLWLDGKAEAALSESVPQVRAPEAWAEGYDGTGVKVAVLDTGIDATHPDLKDAVAAEKSFVPGESTDDGHGHGTHVASTIAGSGAASDGAKKGVAPGARLYVGKVLSDAGDGTDSGVIAGMEWAKEQGVDVVSMSIGTGGASDGSDPVSQAVDRLSADGGPLFVIAAGNNGVPGSVGSPGAAPSALTVGAVTKSDVRAGYSSQGPVAGTMGLKPDIAAPGSAISAAAAHPAPGASPYVSMSGTSMATPHVAGGAAILRQAHPDWDAARIKNALMTSSKKLPAYTPFQLGTGRLDVFAAMTTTIEAPGSVPTATFRWPNANAAPAERTLTYRNTGDAAVTLDLALDTKDTGYSLSAPSVTVPAGGSADVTLRLDPVNLPAEKAVSGQVTATDRATGQLAAHTGFALYKEPERYDYTVELTGRDGKPADGTVALTYQGLSTPAFFSVYGSTTLRLPPRTYTAFTFLDVTGDRSDEAGTAMLVAPDVKLGEGGATARLDASTTHRVSVATPLKTENAQTVVQFRRGGGGGGGAIGSAFIMNPAQDSLYVQPLKAAEGGGQDLLVHWRQRERALDARTGTGHEIQLTSQTGTAHHDGLKVLRTVYAGNGTAADYENLDVKGRAVIVERGGAGPDERAKAAADAGAAMLITANDTGGRLYETYADAHGLTLAGVRRSDGERLIKEAKSRLGLLRVTQERYPDYQYDLTMHQKGSLPDHDLVYRPDHDELARRTERFHAPWKRGPTPEGTGRRVVLPAWGQGLGGLQEESYPGTRVDYLTPLSAETGKWHEEHRIKLAGATTADNMIEYNTDSGYRAGARDTDDWFKPVAAAHFGTGTWVPGRTSNGISWNLPPWTGAAPGHSSISVVRAAESVELRQGETLLAKAGGAMGSYNGLPGQEQAYSLTLDADRTGEGRWDKSVRTHTRWDFRSAAPPAGTPKTDLPLLDVHYDVDTDLYGDVTAGRKVTLSLACATRGGGITATSAVVQVSYDEGATWQPVPVAGRGDGDWTMTLRTPRTGSSVSLRTTAQGPDGLAVTQEVIRAFGLR